MDNFELLKLRREANLSQIELGSRIGYSRQAITKWERGTHPIPQDVADAVIKACTVHIPKPAPKQSAGVREDVANYAASRKSGLSHAEIVAFWAKHGVVPGEETKLAILEAFPDILQPKGN